MKENSIEREEEILNNIKAYMQENIDKGYHKFIYNDLGYDEKCVDVINAIEHILSDYKRVLKENEELKDLMAHKNAYTKKIEKDLFENCSNYVIPIQKIKDKIEELSKIKGDFATSIAVSERIKVLIELLESEEK